MGSVPASLALERAFPMALRAGAAVLAVAAAAFFLYLAWPILRPLLVAIVLATTLWPWVTRITAWQLGPTGWRMPRVCAAALVYLTTFALVAFASWVMVRQALPRIDDLLASYPRQTTVLREYLEPFRQGDVATGARRVAEDVAAEATGTSDRPKAASTAGDTRPAPLDPWALASSFLGGIVTLGLVLIFTFFLLLDGDRYAQWAVMMLPRGQRLWARTIGLSIRDRLSQWVMAQIVYGLASGLIVGGAMWAIGLPTPWLYGLAGTALALFPGVGPALAAIPAFFVATGHSTWQAGVVIVFGVALWAIDAVVIAPRIYGTLLRLPMLVVLVAMLLGAVVMGVWGALIAPPVAAAVQALAREWIGRPPERRAD